MRALLLTIGSQGDVLPFVALAHRLHREGHQPLLVAPRLFQGLADAHRLPFAPLDLDMLRVSDALAETHGLRQFLRFARALGESTPEALESVVRAAEGDFDLVVHHPMVPLGHHLADWAGARSVAAAPTPILQPTRAFTSPMWGVRSPFPRASYAAARRMMLRPWKRELDHWRHHTLGLRRRPGWRDPLVRPDGEEATVLHALSPQVLPRPSDWPAAAHLTGYWRLPELPFAPGRRLREFLAEDDPPVYVGFGSLPLGDPQRIARIVVEAVEQVGGRVIVAGGYRGLRGVTNSDRVHVIRHVPHDWLFPRCAAVVHHGGAGTTGTAITAGVPQIVCPIGFDQPFWARRTRRLGVAPPSPRLRDLSVRGLAPALDLALHDLELIYRAEELGRRVRSEDGTGEALRLLGLSTGPVQHTLPGMPEFPESPETMVKL
ncbi:glycosyltransferase [Actinocorallia sp. B10E7]|uniref:glycosyltransferase n=1 Tax=Actinocorallia sp. B10E7 TaxID=3153558 RepID=UPI00325E3CB5